MENKTSRPYKIYAKYKNGNYKVIVADKDITASNVAKNFQEAFEAAFVTYANHGGAF